MRVRVIVCLTIDNGRLVKTVRFKEPQYIGDPMNAVRIFERKQVDELVLLDITATKEGRKPDFDLIEKITEETFFPFAYGGGITTVDDVRYLIKDLGVEKVVIRNKALTDLNFIHQLADEFGSQSIVVSLDIIRSFFGQPFYIVNNGLKKKEDDYSIIEKLQNAGVGEILLRCVDRDGVMNGYDLTMIKTIAIKADIPVIACGGCGKFDDFIDAVKIGKADAVAAGSYFIYQQNGGGVLIQYPSKDERQRLTK